MCMYQSAMNFWLIPPFKSYSLKFDEQSFANLWTINPLLKTRKQAHRWAHEDIIEIFTADTRSYLLLFLLGRRKKQTQDTQARRFRFPFATAALSCTENRAAKKHGKSRFDKLKHSKFRVQIGRRSEAIVDLAAFYVILTGDIIKVITMRAVSFFFVTR